MRTYGWCGCVANICGCMVMWYRVWARHTWGVVVVVEVEVEVDGTDTRVEDMQVREKICSFRMSKWKMQVEDGG